MPDMAMKPVSALAGVAMPGRYGARPGSPGLALQELGGVEIVALAARKGKACALAEAVRGRWGVDLPSTPRVVESGGTAFVWAGAEQWLVRQDGGEGRVERELCQVAAGLASVTAQGDGRVVLRLGGSSVRAVLSGTVPIDLHPRTFRPGDTALTLAGHVGIQLRQVDDAPTFEILAFRGYAGSLFGLLYDAGLKFGVEVLPAA